MLKRKVGSEVRINPYANVTGEIIETRDCNKDLRFDYKVKLHVPISEDKDMAYAASFDSERQFWWNYYDEDELDRLEKNFSMVESKQNL